MKNIEEYEFNLVEEIEDYAIFILDHEGNITSWNKGAEKIKGYSKDEVISHHYRMFYTQNDQEAKLPEFLLEEARRKGKATNEGRRIGKNQKTSWVNDVITAIHDDDNQVTGFIKISREKTDGVRTSFPENHRYSSELINTLEQRNVALEQIRKNLEHTVHERTEELQTANKELLSSNEELTSANEELSALNEKLSEALLFIQQQSETIIRQKDEQLNQVLDSSNDVIWSADLTGSGNSYISRSIERITGISVSEIKDIFSIWLNVIHPDDKAIRLQSLELLKQQNHVSCSYRLINKLGQEVWMREQIRVEYNTEGIPVRHLGIAVDISSVKEAEKALLQERLMLRYVIDNIPDYIFVTDNQFRHIINNKANVLLLNASSEQETLGKSTVDYFGPSGEKFLKDDEAVFKSGVALINREEYVLNSKGEKIELLTTKVPLKDENGFTVGIVGISRDITEYKKQEHELNQYRENLDVIFNNTKEEILLLDHNGKIICFNKALENFVEKSIGKKPVVGDYVWDIKVTERRRIAKELFQKALQGEASVVEATYNLPDNKLVFHELRYEPVTIAGKIKFVTVISIDISERKKYESELKQNQILLSRAYNIAEMGYWTYDLDTDRSDWNEQAKRMFGLNEHFDASFEGYLSTVHPEDLKKVKEAATLTHSNHKTYDIEYRIIRPIDGAIRWIHERADFIPDYKNSRSLLCVVQDTTVRKKVEEILLEYNQRYDILSKATNDAIWDLDIEQDFEIWNHGIQSIFGYSGSQIKSARQWRKEKIHPSDLYRVELEMANAFKEHRTNWISQYQYLCANGTYKYVLDRAYIIYSDGKPVRMIGAMQDITEQREFEQNIIATARELSELIENANTPIFGTDRNGYVNEWNKVTASLTGYLKNEVLGKRLRNFVSSTQHNNLKTILNHVSLNKPVSDLQIPIITKDNRELTILLNATPRRDTLKNITGILMVGQNITELIEYRQNLEVKVNERTLELNEALSKEKELVEIKSKFVSIASHEFRTPLSTISIVIGFLRKHRKKINDHDFELKLNAIEKQVNHMTYLLDDILMIGKTEAGKITAQHNPIPIKEFFLQIVKEVEESVKTHTINVRITSSVSEFRSDEKLLRNIVINLLTNAIKFSPNREYVAFSISNSTQYLKLMVEDKGIGISEEDLKNIFTSFHRGSNVGNIEGTGLGLSIAKKAIDLLHGTIQINSEIGEGTRFTINLPLQ